MRRRTAAAGALLVGGLLATVPVMAHNLRAASDPLPLSAQGGLTFYQGNNPGASGYYSNPPGFSGAPATQAAEEKSIAERETGRSMRRSEISAHFLSKGLAFIASAPRSWLVLEARKAMALAGDYEPSTEYSFYFERREIRWLYLLMVSGRPRGPALALLLYTLSSALVPLIFYVSSRYRLPLVPALILYAGAFFDRLLQALGGFAARSSGLAPAAALALVVALVSFFPLGRPVAAIEANVHYSIGNLLADRQRDQDALASFDRAIAVYPKYANAWINRGNSLDRLGREDEALASYRRAEDVNPGLWPAYKAEGILLHRRQQYAEEEAAYRRGLATDGEEPWYHLGVALKSQDRLDEAIQALVEATRRNPSYARAHARLGEIYAARGETDKAREEFRKANAAGPGETPSSTAPRRLGSD